MASARWLTDDEAAVWTPFVVSTLRLFARLEAELKERFDISHLDYGVLSQLSFRPDGRIRMAELADRFGVGRRLLRRAAPLHVDTVRRLFVDRIDPADFPVLARVFGELAAQEDASAPSDAMRPSRS